MVVVAVVVTSVILFLVSLLLTASITVLSVSTKTRGIYLERATKQRSARRPLSAIQKSKPSGGAGREAEGRGECFPARSADTIAARVK